MHNREHSSVRAFSRALPALLTRGLRCGQVSRFFQILKYKSCTMNGDKRKEWFVCRFLLPEVYLLGKLETGMSVPVELSWNADWRTKGFGSGSIKR